MRKRRIRAGETLVETLLSMLVILLGTLMLSGAILGAARAENEALQVFDTAEGDPRPAEFDAPDFSDASASYVRLTKPDGASVTVQINVTRYDGAVFYEKYDERAG